MSTFSRLVVYVMAAIPVISVHAETINDYALWNIKSDPRETRWIQIREFQRMEGEEIFHI